MPLNKVFVGAMALMLIAPAAVGQDYVAGNIGDMPASIDQRMADSLTSIGMTRCQNKTLQVARFLMEGGAANFTIQPLGADANSSPTVITMESHHQSNGFVRLSTISVSPNCSGFYQQTIFWPSSCEQVRATVFAAFGGDRRLYTDVRVSELNAGTQLYLLPAGLNGCVSNKKELFR